MNACFICGKTLSEENIVEVKERGIQTLLVASVKRQEKQHELLDRFRPHKVIKKSIKCIERLVHRKFRTLSTIGEKNEL